MGKLNAFIDAEQLPLDDFLSEFIEGLDGNPAEKRGNGHFQEGDPVGHVDFPDFRAVYVGPGRRPGVALVQVKSGWRGAYVPTWPVSVRNDRLEVL